MCCTAIFAAGNMLAGIACGAIAWKSGPRRRLLVGYAALTLTAVRRSGPCTPYRCWRGLGLLVGLCIAPALISGYTLVEPLVPASARTEAFTWLTGAVALGQAAAVTVAGQLADAHGASTGFVVPLAGTALALADPADPAFTARRRAAAGRTVARGSVTACRSRWTDRAEYVTMERR